MVVFSRNSITGRLSYLETQLDGAGGVHGLRGAWSVAGSSDGRNVYVAGRDDDAVAVFSRDGTTGALTFLEAPSDGQGDVDGLNGAVSVAVSPDGRRVFVAGQFDSAVAVFDRDRTTGALTFVESQFDGLNGVNGLALAGGLAVSPDGRHLYVTGSADNGVAVFQIHPPGDEDHDPPVITCPADVDVECGAFGGTSATASSIARFLQGAFAVDAHDPAPSISNDAPAFFPLGVTDVTFTAEDAAGNSASCTANVSVADRTPPSLTGMTMTPAVLWPPNHAMRDVVANYSATDVCSPLTCALSITSTEPIDGTGDGDTAPDWVIGDAHHVQLRAERAGVGSGRTYTTTATCVDSSGNSARSGASVKVKHDSAGRSATQENRSPAAPRVSATCP